MFLVSSFSSDAPTGTEPELRYFIEEEARRNEIERLDLLLKNHPGNDGARIELAQLYLDQSKSEKEQKKEGGLVPYCCVLNNNGNQLLCYVAINQIASLILQLFEKTIRLSLGSIKAAHTAGT